MHYCQAVMEDAHGGRLEMVEEVHDSLADAIAYAVAASRSLAAAGFEPSASLTPSGGDAQAGPSEGELAERAAAEELERRVGADELDALLDASPGHPLACLPENLAAPPPPETWRAAARPPSRSTLWTAWWTPATVPSFTPLSRA